MFTHNSVVFYLILCSFYSEVKIIKPLTSRNCNSERYLVCNNYLNNNNTLVKKLKNIIPFFNNTNSIITLLFPNLDLRSIKNIHKLKYINDSISREQITAINSSIDIVKNKDYYFYNLILSFFSGTFNLNNLKEYNIILNSRIKKSVEWLKKYSINTININY